MSEVVGSIWVLWAAAGQIQARPVPWQAGITVDAAVAASGFFASLAAAEAAGLKAAVHGRQAMADTLLHASDRVELLRPLAMDPKQQRRQAVATARKRARR